MAEQSRIIDVAGVRVRVGDHLTQNIQEYLCSGLYEFAVLRALESKLAPDDVVMELGTGLGVISTYCAKTTSSDRVFTYEATPAWEPLIRDTYALNGVSPMLFMCMLCDRDGEQEFYVPEAYWGSSSGQPPRPVKVRTKRFNDELTRINPSLLIIDIEGGEYELVQYMIFHNVQKLIISIHPRTLGWEKALTVLSVLDKAGFEMDENASSRKVYYLERH